MTRRFALYAYTERNVWSNYHVEAWADEGHETILDKAIESLTELPYKLSLLWPHKNNLSALLLLNE